MTNDELNQYIKHYIEKDQTGRAVMLTGDWGIGKSYYIKNVLIPFLEKPENGNHQCIVISLYSISNILEINKEIYIESRLKKFRSESEIGKIAIFAAKTVLKGIAGNRGIDLNINGEDLKSLYQSVNLSGKLIILEDVERTNINILELLGYINSLVEQDNVKVLLVTNEDEIIQSKPFNKKEQGKDDISKFSANYSNSRIDNESKGITEETLRYLEIKEKSIGDTIHFTGDLKFAVKDIIKSFDNKMIQRFYTDKDASFIVDMMSSIKSNNLRSIIFACQKTSDIYERITNNDLSDDFLKTIFYGIVSFSLRLHSGNASKWIGLELYSQELGMPDYPLFRFCYDYIMMQYIDMSLIPISYEFLNKLRLYDRSKICSDPDLNILTSYYIHTEDDINNVINNIIIRLNDPNDIPLYAYGKIAASLVNIKYDIGVNIDNAKDLLIKNLKGKWSDIDENELFLYDIINDSEEKRNEFIQLREDMIHSLYYGNNIISNSDYSHKNIYELCRYILRNPRYLCKLRGFLKFFDIKKFVEKFVLYTPCQMNSVREDFELIYKQANIIEDVNYIEELIDEIKKYRIILALIKLKNYNVNGSLKN